MIVNIADVWAPVAAPHVTYVNRLIDEFLSMHLAMRPKEARAAAFIQRYRRKIASSTQSDFSRLIAVFERKFPAKSVERKWAVGFFKAVFDYGTFSDKNTKGWNAYNLCAGTRWKVCPYCHIHGTETFISDPMTGDYRPQIDHYYSQAKYPFLGLTLGNLIPCCGQCNGPGFKHVKNFYTTPHLNPLFDSENIGFRLESADVKKIDDPVVQSLRAPVAEYRIGLFPLTACAKTNASLFTFKLTGRYQIYTDEALRIARDVRERRALQEMLLPHVEKHPDPTSRDQMRMHLFTFSSALGLSLAFNPDSDQDYKNHPTGKMKRDIFLRARDE